RKPRSSNLALPAIAKKPCKRLRGFFVSGVSELTRSQRFAALSASSLLTNSAYLRIISGCRGWSGAAHEEATLATSGPATLRDPGVAADLRKTVGNLLSRLEIFLNR